MSGNIPHNNRTACLVRGLFDMDCSDMIIRIVKEHKCPLYKAGDEFELSGRILSLPPNKPACVVLVLDITESHLKNYQNLTKAGNENKSYIFRCSGPDTGCMGVIAAKCRTKPSQLVQQEKNIETIANLLGNFSIFKSLTRYEIRKLVSFLNYKLFEKDDIIIHKGEPGLKLYIIISGKMEVIGDKGASIAFLQKGEVFGEMSLLSGDMVAASVKAMVPSGVLYIDGKNFRKILNHFPSLQMYFAQLLARRLAHTNEMRTEEFASGMSGKLDDIPPSELFQIFNLNCKTGKLYLELSKGKGTLSFNDGLLVKAIYNGKKNEEAFFEILKETSGRFKFMAGLPPEETRLKEFGDFMWLLMEGLNRADEASGR